MSDKRITVKIDPLGNPTIEAHGFNGQGCEQATHNIEHVFRGGGENTREIKDSWHAAEDESNSLHNHMTT